MSETTEVESLNQFLARNGIPSIGWDAIFIGDGSGNAWNKPAGWATVAFLHDSPTPKLFVGGANQASINYAEAIAYLQPLAIFDAEIGRKLLRKSGRVKVLIVTDSQVTEQHGNTAADLSKPLPRTNCAIWGGIRELVKNGYSITYRWVRRVDSVFNQVPDLAASLARTSVMEAKLEDPETGEELDLAQLLQKDHS